MRIALVNYNVSRMANEPSVKTVMKHFGVFPNIQLLYVAAVLERLGVEVDYLDMPGLELSDQDVRQRLLRFDPDMVGLSVFTSHYHNAVSYARFFKSFLPRARILVGGVHMLIYPEQTLVNNEVFDFGCVGEAEVVLPEFIRRIRSNETLEGLPGLVWRDGSAVRFAGPAPLHMDLDSSPLPARHLAPNHRYFNFISTRRNYTVVNTSRGCPFRCIFCEAGGQKWRARSAANVVAEFEECYGKYGVREIDIFDSSFTVSKQRVLDICRLLEKNGLARKMIWDVRSRVDTIDEEMLEALRAGGCYRIFYGIESGDPAILETLRKGIKLSRVEEIVRKTDRLGISAFGYFLIGAPGETPETARKTIDFAKRLPLDFAIFNCLTAFPKTELYEKHYLPYVDRDFWADYLTKPKAVEEFMGRPWTQMSDDELRKMAHNALNEFYFRPGQLWRAIRSVRSLDQFRRYASAGWDMLLSRARGAREIGK